MQKRINDVSAAFPPAAPSLLRPYRLGPATEEHGSAMGVLTPRAPPIPLRLDGVHREIHSRPVVGGSGGGAWGVGDRGRREQWWWEQWEGR